MVNTIPLFSTSSSLKQGGIFTVEKSDRDSGPVSLINFVKEEKLDQITLVESNFENFMAGVKNFDNICKFNFALKLLVCSDMNDKSDESFKSESKVVIFLGEDIGYKSLIKIYSKAAIDGFYYVPRIDWKILKEMWSEHLILALPFYSSFLAVNSTTFNSVVPDFPVNPIILKEENQQLPFDNILNNAVESYSKSNNFEVQSVKSIYYKNRQDAKQFLIWRSILNQSSWNKPQMDFMGSKEFCWEAYKQL